jgi:hypothetical protein
LIFLKDQKGLILYLYEYTYNLIIGDFLMDKGIISPKNFCFYHSVVEGTFYYSMDLVAFTETKVIILSHDIHGRTINARILDFFNDYKTFLVTSFYINTINQKMHIFYRYSLIFKYKDVLGFQFSNIVGQHGYVLFGYFNSTDPKPIYNLKKDGLNYRIKLNDYLNLQSNIFNYKIKGIKILKSPNYNSSGLFFISNNTKHQVEENDIVDFETSLSLNFKYNNIIKKGNYLFKFAGVLEEPTYNNINRYSDSTIWSFKLGFVNATILQEKYINVYDTRRNLNIIGKASLFQINVLEDIQVFCNKEYDDKCLKSNDNKCLTCGEGTYYNIDNSNEITQYLIGENYYFDSNKQAFIKCHSRCKKCSKEYNKTSMQCDECIYNDKYFLTKEKNCLEKSYCKYNFYYDDNFDLFCINKTNTCPDFKPYELSSTKECIEKCNLNEMGIKCNPTNNIISINETYKLLHNDINNLNLERKLFIDKQKFIINRNNVSFIFSTTEIEKEELYINFNSSSILINECEKLLRKNKPLVIFNRN